ncbi:MAG: fluoride efflux transporter CrcB [Bacteroidetes bacterium]|nr:fluoride efflux transporter CrcB [Bacteroidota bacterium]
MMRNFILVGIGGALGTMLRYAVALLITSKNFPAATLTVNIVGSFIIGLVVAYSIKNEVFLQNWKLFLTTGICGGFTTFSAFSSENILLLQSGRTTTAFIYIAVSIIAGMAAAWLGFKIFENA